MSADRRGPPTRQPPNLFSSTRQHTAAAIAITSRLSTDKVALAQIAAACTDADWRNIAEEWKRCTMVLHEHLHDLPGPSTCDFCVKTRESISDAQSITTRLATRTSAPGPVKTVTSFASAKADAEAWKERALSVHRQLHQRGGPAPCDFCPFLRGETPAIG